MKKTTHILSALAVSAVVAFGAVSCNQTKGEAAESQAADTTEVAETAPKGAIVYLDMTRVGWSYMFKARANNAGWRIDYFVVSNRIADKIADATIYSNVLGSDHCPVGLTLT